MNTSYDEENYAYRVHAGYNSDNYSSDDQSDFDEVYEKNKPPPVLIDHSIYHVIKIEAFQEVVSKKNSRYGLYKNSLSAVEKPGVPLQIQQGEDNVDDISRKKNVIQKLGNEQSFLVHSLDNSEYRESEKASMKTVNESDKQKNNQTQTKARANNEAILLKHEKKFPQDQWNQLRVSSSLLNNQKTNSIIDNQQTSEAKPVNNLVRNNLCIRTHSKQNTKVKNTINVNSKRDESITDNIPSESDRKPFLSWIADFYQTKNLNRTIIQHNNTQHIVDDISDKAKETNFSTHAFLPKSINSSQHQVHYVNPRLEAPVNNAWKLRFCANTRISRRINICKSQRNKYAIKRIIQEEYEIKRTMAVVLLGVSLLSLFLILCNYLKCL
ncbi:uncharacterized protein LOC116159888 [Photinus pyralis]|uniref:Uncharacterized protein n=1 Tax=Photinus pyralis TaxID=7054 RepID=A0A1Y1L7T1_PHOPY|nr:uncharacterized protein LOC116159888 [Photinus pyralis]